MNNHKIDVGTSGKHFYQAVFLPDGKKCEISGEQTILEAARLVGIDILAACGGAGSCGTCLVKIIIGSVSDPTIVEKEILSEEQLSQGYRLACQAMLLSDTQIWLPDNSVLQSHQFMVDGITLSPGEDPANIFLDISMVPPSLQDPKSDLTRVNEILLGHGFSEIGSSPAGITQLSTVLHNNNWTARLALQQKGNTTKFLGGFPPQMPLLGVALDIGSTKIALYLVDLESGITPAQSGILNPQTTYGDDVISRIAFANESDLNRRKLHEVLINTVNEAIRDMCQDAGYSPGNIIEVSAVGNPTMHHFLTDLPVTHLGSSPYVPVVSEVMHFRAKEIGIEIAPAGMIYLPPLIAGFLGSDHIAALITCLPQKNSQPVILIDIGTNTEISLIVEGKILSCSTASGPAFEGAQIQQGVRAANGAIDKIFIRPDGVEYKTIGNAPPNGLCGTGILSAVSELLIAGILNRSGSFKKNDPRLTLVKGLPAFPIVKTDSGITSNAIIVTGRDVRQVQLAKGAIRTGIDILLKESNISASSVNKWYIAGGFGTFLDITEAIRIGMLPAIDKNLVHQVGNAAGMGAKAMLLSRNTRSLAEHISRQAVPIDLTLYPGFSDIYIDNLVFPDRDSLNYPI